MIAAIIRELVRAVLSALLGTVDESRRDDAYRELGSFDERLKVAERAAREAEAAAAIRDAVRRMPDGDLDRRLRDLRDRLRSSAP